jgi:hypothetical protein
MKPKEIIMKRMVLNFFLKKKSGMKLKRKSIRRRVKNKININGKKENQIQHQNKIKYNDKE